MVQVYTFKIMKFIVYIKRSKSKEVIMKFKCANHTSAIDYACQIKKLDYKSFTDIFNVQQIVEI